MSEAVQGFKYAFLGADASSRVLANIRQLRLQGWELSSIVPPIGPLAHRGAVAENVPAIAGRLP